AALFCWMQAWAFGPTVGASHLVIEILDSNSTMPVTSDQAILGSSARIQMTTDFAQGQIFYTLDGAAPSFASTRYSNRLAVSSNFVLRAVAYNLDFSESESRQVQVTILPTYQVNVTGDPGGLVDILPSQSSYLSNTVVQLSAHDANGWFFQRWTGDIS